MSSAFCFLFTRSWVTHRWVFASTQRLGPFFANDGLAFSFSEDINTETSTYDYLSFAWSILSVFKFSSPSSSQWSSGFFTKERAATCRGLHQHLGTAPHRGPHSGRCQHKAGHKLCSFQVYQRHLLESTGSGPPPGHLYPEPMPVPDISEAPVSSSFVFLSSLWLCLAMQETPTHT